MLDVGGEEALEVAGSDDHDTVEALGAHRANPPLGIGVRSWGSPRSADDLDAFGLEDFVKGASEPVIAIVDEEADWLAPFLPYL